MNKSRKEYFKDYYRKNIKDKVLNVKLTEIEKINNKLDNIIDLLSVKLTNSTYKITYLLYLVIKNL